MYNVGMGVVTVRRIFGDREKINLGSSEFRRYIETDCLYVDKTRFIEHVLDEASTVLHDLR